MSDVPMPLPDDDSTPPPDPFEAELVAYLDGELDPVAARKVETRLASDPAARAKADELKKTFDLLDYLPKPEPSPNFTTRTLDKLPAITNIPKPAATQATPPPRHQTQTASAVANPKVPAPRASAPSQPVPVPLDNRTMPLPRQGVSRTGVWATMILVAVSACGAIGYFAAVAFRSQPRAQILAPPPEELAPGDSRVIEYLPLYAAIDDFGYLHELADPDFFGDEPAVTYDWKVPAVEAEKMSGSAFEKMSQAFKALPADRQKALRELDKQLHAQDALTRDRYIRVLEAHASWLDRLLEADRKNVFAASTSRQRLDEIRKIRNDQWVDALPVTQRTELRKLPPQQRDERMHKWKEEEAGRRDEWAFVRQHAHDILDNKAPWPFDSSARQKEVIEFMRVSFRPDDDKKCRFTANELVMYKLSLSSAEKNGGWLTWGAYGKVCYELTRKYEKYLMPEPAAGEPITTYQQLGPVARFFEKDKGGGHNATVNHVGKWPDFALAVHDYATQKKADKIPLGPLGPAKPGDFKEPLKTFVTKELYPSLKDFEKLMLSGAEGHWPRYPQELVKMAKSKDLCAPGMMLPGSPKKWDAIYNPTFGFPRPPFGPKP